MDELMKQETMSSLQIAEISGKQHKHVMEAIRAMEDAWFKVNGTKFRLVRFFAIHLKFCSKYFAV